MQRRQVQLAVLLLVLLVPLWWLPKPLTLHSVVLQQPLQDQPGLQAQQQWQGKAAVQRPLGFLLRLQHQQAQRLWWYL